MPSAAGSKSTTSEAWNNSRGAPTVTPPLVTFLVAFLLQNTQNRDTHSLQLKLDELIRASEGARNQLLNLERLSDDELARLQREFERLARSRATGA